MHNFGRSGATAQDGTDRPYRDQDEYRALTSTPFDLAIVTLGTNDAKVAYWDPEKYRRDYKALIAAIRRSSPKGEVALGIPVPYDCCKSAWGDDPDVINSDLGRIVRDIADEMHIERLVDFYAAMGGDEPNLDWYHDQIHPNYAGYDQLGFAQGRQTF